ncbi:hypothetical protein [Streptomyces sp. NPDC048669]|uniref:hypothetical protein n=1 Tax=Streptomyces sp. NPDC048669 TaxID=3155267 RepID=UPI003427B077
MSPVTTHLTPKSGKELTLEDLRELVQKTKDLNGKSLIVATVNNRQTKIGQLDIDIVE